jgi:hypothetical protein
MGTGDILLLAGMMVMLAALGEGARRALLQQMRGQSPAVQATTPLAPAEMAYLLRDGDMSHTLIVMSVDMIQRVVKSQTSSSLPTLRPYEKQVWLSVKEFLKQLAEQKAGHLVPVTNIKNPVQWAVRFNAIKRFFGENLRTLVTEVIKDPRHIRKYFSIAGVARLAVQLYTSSVRGAVERELRDELLKAGLLVTEARRRKYAALIMLLIPGMVAGSLAASAFTHVSVPLLLAVLGMGALNAAILQVVGALPGFVPTYEEFAKVSAELKRSSARLTAVRTVLRAGKVIIYAVLAVLAFVLLAAELAFTAFVLNTPGAMPLLIAATLLGTVVVLCIRDWHGLAWTEQPTILAQSRMAEAKETLAKTSPLGSLTALMGDPDYDPTFSQLVAYYGIETLWLLS